MVLIMSMDIGLMVIALGSQMKSVKYNRIISPILLTIVSLGPIGWFFIDLSIERYDRMTFLFTVSIILTIATTLFWIFYFKYKDYKDPE